MATVRKSLVVISLTVAVLGFGHSSGELAYSCNPSGAITVLNPDPAQFVNAIAELSATQQECPTLVTFLKYTFVIYNCPTSHNITFILLKNTTRPEVYMGGMQYHTLRCQQIPATGVFRKVTDESWVTNYVMSSVTPSVTPQILLDMEMQDVESRVQRRNAIVGETLRWEIQVYENYISQPLNCTMLSGAGDEAISIVLNGCSLNTFLLTHFDYDSPSTRHILAAQLFAFRFANSNRIIIECKMLGCRDRYPSPTPCDFSCPEDRKRRDTEHADEQRGNGDILGNKPHTFGTMIHYVRTEIDVFEPQAFPLTAGSQTTPNHFGMTVFALLCCLLVVIL